MNNRIVILGAGESGTGAAVLAKEKGFDVFVSDLSIVKPRYKELLYKYDIQFEEEKHTDEIILEASEVIKSPGIPDSSPIIQAIKKKGIRIISEIEFAGRFTKAKKICITGSNGKTTTTSLIHHMMKKAGMNVGLAGNIGNSFAMQVVNDEYDYYVIELSSFQLDGVFDFKADIAILLNITPDHLDRYYNMQGYVESKFKIIQNLGEDEYFIFCSDDEVTIRELERIVTKAKQLSFSLTEKTDQGAYLEDGEMNIEYDDVDFNVSLDDLNLKGKHNIYNSMAASLAGCVLKIRKEDIRESLQEFRGVEHRLENCNKVHGIEFINDSKATNINSTWYALECMKNEVIWIAGGVDKGNDYGEIFDLVKSKVKALVCLGTDNTKLKEAFEGTVKTIIETTSMKDAVKSAYLLGTDGDTVLLSPACASFDLFESYEDRGAQFKNMVKEL